MPPVDELDSSTPIVVPLLLLLLLLLLLELDSVSAVVLVIVMSVVGVSVVELPEVISVVASVIGGLLVDDGFVVIPPVPVLSVSAGPDVFVPSSPQANAAQTKVK